jgi:hypothetical protein
MLASDARNGALKRGVDELQTRLEWILRNRSRALKFAQRRYMQFARKLYRAIEETNRCR